MTIITKIIRWIVVAFFASTILVVVWYKFVPVWVTPLMVIRGVEQVSEGHMPKMHHSWMALDNMPKEMPEAVMASEDQRFLIHHGFDFDAIQKAIKRNKKAGVKKIFKALGIAIPERVSAKGYRDGLMSPAEE